jgi:peroxiredoxin
MVLLEANNLKFYKNSFELPEFNLKNVNEKILSEKDVLGENGLLVCFICNHCPYVKAIIGDLVDNSLILMQDYQIQVVCINSNDSENPKYAEDSFEKMKEFSFANNFPFPYLHDENQDIAKKFDAVCTPDFFLFLKNHENQRFFLNYKGRLNNFVYKFDGPETSKNFHGKKHELLDYVQNLFKKPFPSMGCSIKWKN